MNNVHHFHVIVKHKTLDSFPVELSTAHQLADAVAFATLVSSQRR